MEYSIELFGATPDGKTDSTAALKEAIDRAGSNGGGKVIIPQGSSYKVGPVTVTYPFITITGGGTLIDAVFHVGKPAPYPIPDGFQSQEYCFELTGVYCKSSTQGNLNLFEGENAAVVTLKDLRVRNYNAVASIVPDDLAGTAPNNVTWLYMENIRFSDVNYLIYTDKLDNQKLALNDFTITKCTGTARISHVRMRGIDGLDLESNTFLFPGYAEKCMTKKHNIDIDYCQWVTINDNRLYEAGEDAIRLSNFTEVTMNDNIIGWCGQVKQGHGIYLFGGDVDGNNVCSSTVGTNAVLIASGSGVYVEGNVGAVNISDVNVYCANDGRYYYGTDALSTDHWAVYCADSTQNCKVSDCSSLTDRYYVGPLNYIHNCVDADRNIIQTFRGKYVNDGGATPSAKGCEYIKFNHPNPTTITNILDGYPGQEIRLYGMNNNTTIAKNSNFVLQTYVIGVTIPTGGWMEFTFAEGKWRETGRSWMAGEITRTVVAISNGLLDMNYSDRVELEFPAPTTIYMLTSGAERRVITLYGNNGNATLSHTDNIRLKTDANTIIPADEFLRLEYMKGKWREIYRSW